jgi:hypothetical protein
VCVSVCMCVCVCMCACVLPKPSCPPQGIPRDQAYANRQTVPYNFCFTTPHWCVPSTHLHICPAEDAAIFELHITARIINTFCSAPRFLCHLVQTCLCYSFVFTVVGPPEVLGRIAYSLLMWSLFACVCNAADYSFGNMLTYVARLPSNNGKYLCMCSIGSILTHIHRTAGGWNYACTITKPPFSTDSVTTLRKQKPDWKKCC